MTTDRTKLVLVDQSDPIFDRALAGASVSWELVKSVDHEALVKALKAADIPHVPEPSTPAAALLRMMSELYADRNCLVRPAPNPTGSKRAAYAVLPKKDQDARMAFVEEWSAGVDLVQETDGKTTWQEPAIAFSESAPDAAREEMFISFPTYLATLGSGDLSTWLVSLVKSHLRGVPTVGGAGTFFLGPEEVPVWRRLGDALKPFGVRLYEIPAMRTSQAVECVVESVKRYTQKAVAELEADLAEYRKQAEARKADPKVRRIQDRALQVRLERINEQTAIVAKYEKLFDTKLTEVRTSLEDLQAGFGQVAMLEMAS